MEIIIALGLVVLASIIIMYACESFEDSADYLGRNMKPGIKGATINAIGSSLPELFTTMALLFIYHDEGGFAAGIATTAGSAVFNAIVIPMLCIFVIRYKGVVVDNNVAKAKRVYKRVTEVAIDKPSVLRDGLFLLFAEIVLIVFLGGTEMAWWMGGALIVVYLCYFAFLMRGFSNGSIDEPEDDDDEYDDGEDKPSKLKALLTFDFNHLFYNGVSFNNKRAWVVLSFSVTVIGFACVILAEAVMMSARALGVPAFFTAIILAAAASSVPDTILSMKDAVKGQYDDAISNALGSNIFDITVALGLPLMIYGLLYGNVSLGSNEDIQFLRIVLVATTVCVLAIFLLQKKLNIRTAYAFGAIYLSWLGYVIYKGLQTMA